MRLRLRSVVSVSIAALILSILVLPVRMNVIGNRSLGNLQRKQSRAPRQARRGAANENGDPLSQLFLPARNSSTPLMPQADSPIGVTHGIQYVRPAQFNGDVRDLPRVASKPHEELEHKMPRSNKQPAPEDRDQTAPNIPLAPMPSAIQNFAGLSRTDLCPPVTGSQCGAGTPPDINGDVGPNHYIEAVNDAYAIYNKTGTLLASFTENALFSGGPTGTLCDTDSFGDPVVVYDQFADRWILTNFAFVLVGSNQVPPTFQCFAVSKTSNPVSGGWWLYAVQIDTGAVGQPPTGTLGDYPKFGNWNDGCLYMGANGFSSAGIFNGVIFASFSKAAMESGAALTASNSSLGFLAFPANNIFTLVPSNISGAKGSANVPPSGTPNYFVSESQTAFAYQVRKFTPGAGCGTGGTMGASTNVSQTSYTVPPGDDVPQPNVATLLDSIDDRIMQKTQYRRVGATESLWVVHNAKSGATERPQWSQINVTGGTVVSPPVQQQIYAPDTTINRWMGSIAADHNGNVALGYTTSNGTAPNFPSIAYSGRLVGDAVNTLPQTEVQLQVGAGSQNHTCGGSPCTRWGDYSSMSVDPTDDCTFWYTNEYYDTQANGTAGNWHTRIGSFKFPSCNAPSAANSSISGQVITADGNPLAGVTVVLEGAESKQTVTNSQGNFRFSNIETGQFYIVTPELNSYGFSPANRSFSLVGDKTDAVFTAVPDNGTSTNVIDSSGFFVRQQYLDFLGREPETTGFNYWHDQLDQCHGDADCLHNRRIDVSAAFFQSEEFRDTGSFVYRLYRGTLGRQLRFEEFATDRAQVIGGPNLEASKATFANAFVQRAEFAAKYQDNTSAASFVDALLRTMNDGGVDLASARAALIDRYNEGGNLAASRALVVRDLVDNSTFMGAVYHETVVAMQYYGYLRRTPEPQGFEFWLDVLNRTGDHRGMVCSFLTSAEYQRRFSSVVTHSNADCSR
jgi:Carboxypeptidase regulatory-like domain/Domain of unknown function (DUF4214)